MCLIFYNPDCLLPPRQVHESDISATLLGMLSIDFPGWEFHSFLAIGMDQKLLIPKK